MAPGAAHQLRTAMFARISAHSGGRSLRQCGASPAQSLAHHAEERGAPAPVPGNQTRPSSREQPIEQGFGTQKGTQYQRLAVISNGRQTQD
jgi:hypothetical protein